MTKITVDKALIDQAIEALEGVCHAHGYQGGTPVAAVTALRAALAEPAVEPVAYRSLLASGSYTYCITKCFFDNAEPLYASPPPTGPDVKDCLTTEPLITTGAMSGMVDAQVQDLWPTKSALVQPVVEPVKKGLFVDLIAQHPGLAEELAAIVINAPAKPVVEPVAVRYDFDGYGWKYIDNGSGSDWLERGMSWKDHELIYTAPTPPAEPAVEPVAVVTDVDEYGPKLGWYAHWAQFPVGTKLYAPATRKPSQMLTEVRAMFVPPPSTAEPAVEPADDNLRESFAQCLTSVYVCGRVWSAWSYGTMTEYDFSLGSECDELLDALVWTHKTIIGLSKAAPQAQKPAEVPLLTDAEISTVTNNQWGIQVTSVMHQAHRAYARAIEKAVRQKAGLV